MNRFLLILEKMGVEKRNIKPFLIFLIGVTALSLVLIFTPFFSSTAPLVLVIFYGVFFTLLWFMAGYVVFRALLTASVGLSLVLFIAQSYCSLRPEQQVADASLMTLIGFGFIYVGVQFIQSLFKELFGNRYAKEEWRQKGIVGVFKESNNNKHSWFVLIVYGLLVSLFLWQVYSVIMPIIHGLCVYQKLL